MIVFQIIQITNYCDDFVNVETLKIYALLHVLIRTDNKKQIIFYLYISGFFICSLVMALKPFRVAFFYDSNRSHFVTLIYFGDKSPLFAVTHHESSQRVPRH